MKNDDNIQKRQYYYKQMNFQKKIHIDKFFDKFKIKLIAIFFFKYAI